jgi:chemotaxis protein CheD
VSNDREAQIVTHALGSCVAICVWDPVAIVAGLMHVLLPDSRINPARARRQPAAFVDSGLPLLFRTAAGYGVVGSRCVVRLVGGADVCGVPPRLAQSIGARNVAAARSLLRQFGVSVRSQIVGGTAARTVAISVGDGFVQTVTAGRTERLP